MHASSIPQWLRRPTAICEPPYVISLGAALRAAHNIQRARHGSDDLNNTLELSSRCKARHTTFRGRAWPQPKNCKPCDRTENKDRVRTTLDGPVSTTLQDKELTIRLSRG
jgi:hypothetical protein